MHDEQERMADYFQHLRGVVSVNEYEEVVAKLRRLAWARDRSVDREVRTVTFTDDEALVLVRVLDGLPEEAGG